MHTQVIEILRDILLPPDTSPEIDLQQTISDVLAAMGHIMQEFQTIEVQGAPFPVRDQFNHVLGDFDAGLHIVCYLLYLFTDWRVWAEKCQYALSRKRLRLRDVVPLEVVGDDDFHNFMRRPSTSSST